jgi:hypothetical protein
VPIPPKIETGKEGSVTLEQEKARALKALNLLLDRIVAAENEVKLAQKRLEGLFPLKVVWKKRTCGKESCRCARGVLHGPYPYMVEYRKGEKVERYLGKGWTPPEGMIAPERYKELLRELKARRKKLEDLLDTLEEAIRLMEGADLSGGAKRGRRKSKKQAH